MQQEIPKGTDHEIIVDGGLDYATVTPTEYYDELEIPILSINLKGRSMYFVLKRVINNTS